MRTGRGLSVTAAIELECRVNMRRGAIGFGKAKPGGGGYPAIFIVGFVSDVFGIYRSDDNASTRVLLTRHNHGHHWRPKTFTEVYISLSETGFTAGHLNWLRTRLVTTKRPLRYLLEFLSARSPL